MMSAVPRDTPFFHIVFPFIDECSFAFPPFFHIFSMDPQRFLPPWNGGDAGPETVVWDPDAPCGDGTHSTVQCTVIEMGTVKILSLPSHKNGDDLGWFMMINPLAIENGWTWSIYRWETWWFTQLKDGNSCSGWWFGTWNLYKFMTFPSYWECHHPNWRFVIFFGGVGQPPTSVCWDLWPPKPS